MNIFWPFLFQNKCRVRLLIMMLFVAMCIPLLIQQNVDGSNAFNRSWAEFKVGFNDSRGNYWLGNQLLHELTTNNLYKLRFDLQAINSTWYYAEYSSFIVLSEATNYTLRVSGYSGNIGGDAFSWHDGMKFTTYDSDNDLRGFNCAAHNGGGFWHKGCAKCSVNAIRGSRGDSFRWLNSHTETGNVLLQTSRMWLTC